MGEGDGVNIQWKKWRKILWRLYVLFGAGYLAVLAGMLVLTGTLDPVDNIVSDAIYQCISRNQNENMIKIVMIDSDTVEKLGDYQDWSRSKTAEFIEILNCVPKDAPNVIGLDLLYSEKKDYKGDKMLKEICKKYDNICIGTPAVIQKNEPTIKEAEVFDFIEDTEPVIVSDVILPYQDLLPYTITGVTNIAKYSVDGYIRNAVANITIDDIEMDSFPVAIYKMYRDSIGEPYSLPKLDIDRSFAFNYSKRSTDYTVYSFYDVLTGEVPASTFRNSIVLVGDDTKGERTYKVPNQRNTEMTEIEVHANILEALMTQKTGLHVSRTFLAFYYGIFVGAFFIVISFSGGLRTIIEATLLLAVQMLGCCILNKLGYYVPVLIPIIFVIGITVMNLGVNYIRAKRERAVLEGVFKKYVDEQVVNEIVKEGGIEAKIGVIRKDIAVLFVDLRGFTTLSESLEPEQVVDILNSYLSLVANAVAKNGGTLDKFIGDAAMAVFNSPADIEDYVFRAICTAWDIRDSASGLDQKYKEKYGKLVTFGIGVHCGEAVIGNIGCASRMDYTAIGDTVNTASRLEGIAASGQILISSEVRERIKDRIKTVFTGEISLKGKKEKVSVYEVKGIFREEEEEGRKFLFGWRSV